MWAIYSLLKNLILGIQGGTATLESITVNQEAVLDAARSAQSAALLTMTGAEQTLYEKSSTTLWLFEGGNIDLSALAADDTAIIRIYKKIKSGGAYVKFTSDPDLTFTGVQDPPGIEIAGDRFNTYGLKVTIQQTVAGTSYKTIDHEWADAAPGV